jgi:uncharacterized Zn finger protein (UPF0148 family)
MNCSRCKSDFIEKGTSVYCQVRGTDSIIKNTNGVNVSTEIAQLKEELESETRWAKQYSDENERLKAIIRQQTYALKEFLSTIEACMGEIEEYHSWDKGIVDNAVAIGEKAIKAGEGVLK